MAATADEFAAGPVPEADQGHPQRWRIPAVLGAVAFMAQLTGRTGTYRRKEAARIQAR